MFYSEKSLIVQHWQAPSFTIKKHVPGNICKRYLHPFNVSDILHIIPLQI